MKRIIALVLCLAALLCTFAGCAKEQDSEVPKGMQLASGENVDYFMYVPEAWKVDKSELYTAAYFSAGDATSISATAYGISAEIQSVSDWWKAFEPQMTALYKDVSEITETEARIDGIEGREYSFTAKLNEKEYNFIVTAVIKDLYVYYITYTSTPEYNEDHLEERVQVIENFDFKD